MDSHEKTVAKGRYEITQVADRLGVRPREEMVAGAHRLYKLAVQRNFTRGRRTQQVAGACLYIVCRQEGRPYMLIDFSDALQTNVYVLGSVFLQLCRLLRLEQHPIMQRPVDPSLFIHRFADKLDLDKKSNAVATTALRLVASMKRDWMQTGRRPAGVCGAALFIAAHIHGLSRGKKEVVSVVHVCEATLQKRLSEFQQTGASDLTVEEFDQRANDVGATLFAPSAGQPSEMRELTCEHAKQPGVAHFAHGMCLACYQQFDKVSGGLSGGTDPPSYRRAQLKEAAKREARIAARLKKERDASAGIASEMEAVLAADKTLNAVAQRALPEAVRPIASGNAVLMPPPQAPAGRGADANGSGDGGASGGGVSGGGAGPSTQAHSAAAATDLTVPVAAVQVPLTVDDIDLSEDEKDDDYEEQDHPQEETLSDVDDEDIDKYIHSEKEVALKEKVWKRLHADYLEQQEVKQQRKAAQEKANKHKIHHVEKEKKSKEGKGKGKSKETDGKKGPTARNPGGPPKSAGEATAQMLAKKRISTKINYEALNKLFKDTDAKPGKKASSGAKGAKGLGAKGGIKAKAKAAGKGKGKALLPIPMLGPKGASKGASKRASKRLGSVLLRARDGGGGVGK